MIPISQFFLFWDQIAKGSSYPFLGVLHCLQIMLIPLVIGGCAYWCKAQTQHTQKRFLLALALAVPIVEGLRIIWLIALQEGNWFKLLPLHLCGTQVLFVPLAILSKKQVFQDYIWCTSLLGGITAIVYPAGIVGTYPFFHFQTIQSFVYHMLLILVPLIMKKVDHYKPQPRNLYKVMSILLLCASCALFIDVLYRQNYMFLLEVPQVFPLTWIFSVFGYPGYWVTLGFSVSCGCAIALTLPNIHKLKLNNKK